MLQMTRIVSAFVNGGYLMKPQLVKEVIDETGEVVQRFEPIVEEQIISESTSTLMKELFEAAVQTGGGRNAYIEGITVGGKSGTTKKIVDGEYADDIVISSFIGIAPMENPEYVVLVTIDEPQNEVQGSTVVAPVVKAIFEDILRYRNIIPDVSIVGSVDLPDLREMSYEEAVKALDKLGLRHSTDPLDVEELSLKVIDQYPKGGTKVEKGSIVILSIEQ
jgi:stage V sporulation protein D (sporulation-specific penicillin-binding protein)